MNTNVTFVTSCKPFIAKEDIKSQYSFAYAMHVNECKVLVIGDDEGAKQFCDRFGFSFEPTVKRFQKKHPMLKSMMAVARDVVDTPNICIINSDIILQPGFHAELVELLDKNPKALITAKRFDGVIRHRINTMKKLNRLWLTSDMVRHKKPGTDFFAFNINWYFDALQDIPDFVFGSFGWDSWLQRVASLRVPTALKAVTCLNTFHPNHVSHHYKSGSKATKYNKKLFRNFIRSAKYKLAVKHIEPIVKWEII